MCGIAGFCGFGQDCREAEARWNGVLSAMGQAVAHRGGDGFGTYLRRHAGLAHARLSIRDLSPAGAQPMVRTREGREYAITYNGEIYNADELREELETAGFVFGSTADTEVLLLGYIREGTAFFRKLNGIYAFGIWDEAAERLVLCRDRLGVKPLFYTERNGQLVFGSELKALFRHPEAAPRADLDTLREVFGLGPAHTPGCGVFAGVREVLPGAFGVFSAGGYREERYWNLVCRPHTDSYAETVEKVSFLVRDAVRRQMVSDVPVCSFLSGGIDSSIVTAVAADCLRASGGTLNTFSFDFRQNDVYFQANAFQPEQDRPYVDEMLTRCATNHRYLECDEAELARLLCPAMRARDLPGMADVDASLLYFCALVKRHNKVALTGECADEIFGGYPWFYREELAGTDGFPWSRSMETRTLLLRRGLAEKLELEDYAHARYRESLAEVPETDEDCPYERRRRELSYLSIKWFMQTLLDRMDRASMYSGLEARVPYADHRIAEYLFNVPWKMKYQKGTEKSLLREACADLLPERILHRRKSPYPKTYNPNYERLLSEELGRVAEDPAAPVMQLLDRERVRDFLRAPHEYGKPWFGQLMAGPQLMAYMLQVNCWLQDYLLL